MQQHLILSQGRRLGKFDQWHHFTLSKDEMSAFWSCDYHGSLSTEISKGSASAARKRPSNLRGDFSGMVYRCMNNIRLLPEGSHTEGITDIFHRTKSHFRIDSNLIVHFQPDADTYWFGHDKIVSGVTCFGETCWRTYFLPGVESGRQEAEDYIMI